MDLGSFLFVLLVVISTGEERHRDPRAIKQPQFQICNNLLKWFHHLIADYPLLTLPLKVVQFPSIFKTVNKRNIEKLTHLFGKRKRLRQA